MKYYNHAWFIDLEFEQINNFKDLEFKQNIQNTNRSSRFNTSHIRLQIKSAHTNLCFFFVFESLKHFLIGYFTKLILPRFRIWNNVDKK